MSVLRRTSLKATPQGSYKEETARLAVKLNFIKDIVRYLIPLILLLIVMLFNLSIEKAGVSILSQIANAFYDWKVKK